MSQKVVGGALCGARMVVRTICGQRQLWADSVEKLFDFGASVFAIALIFSGCVGLVRLSSFCGHHRLELGQFPEVLGGGCEGELVLNATWAA